MKLTGLLVIVSVVAIWFHMRVHEGERRYAQIRVGMSASEVKAVMGRPCDWDSEGAGEKQIWDFPFLVWGTYVSCTFAIPGD
jgi:hypothetical protein